LNAPSKLVQLTCIWHTDSLPICSSLPLVGCIKVSDDFTSQTKACSLSLSITLFTPLCLTSVTWSPWSFGLPPYHQHSWPLLCVTTLITSCLLYWLIPMVTKSTTKSFHFQIKLSFITTTQFISASTLHLWSANL